MIDLGDARAGADGLIVEFQSGNFVVLERPFGIHGEGECRARAVQGLRVRRGVPEQDGKDGESEQPRQDNRTVE